MQAEVSVTPLSDPPSPTAVSVLARVGKGFGALSTGAAVQIVGQLTVVPVALYAWGKVRYGEWLVLTGLVTFLKLTDLGLQTYVGNRMCASYARGERDEVQAAVNSALRIQIPLVIFTFAGIAIALVGLPIRGILALETITNGAVITVGLLLALEFLINVPTGILSAVYRATGRLPRGALVSTCQQFAVMAFTIGLIAFHSSFASVAVARLAVVVGGAAWIAYDLRRLYPWLHLRPGLRDWKKDLWMVGPGLFFILIPISDFLSTQVSLIVLQRFQAGGEVSRLATHRTVVNLSVMISGLLTNAMWPELTALHARSHDAQLIKAHRGLARINLWLVGTVLFGLLPFLPFIYRVWTAGELELDSLTLGLLIARGLLWSVWTSSLTVLCSINRHQVVAGSLLAGAFLSGLLTVILIPRFGIAGAAAAQLMGDVCISAWLIPLFAVRATGDRYFGFMSTTLAALCQGLIIPVGLGFLGWQLLSSEALRLFVLVPLVTLTGLTLMWWALSPSERSHLMSLSRLRRRNRTLA